VIEPTAMVQLNRQYERSYSLEEPITIKVVGVGGAGSNALDRVMLDGIDAVEMVAINTDAQSLAASVATQKVQLGRSLTRGLGTGGDPELGLAAAQEAVEEIRGVLRGGNVIFICTGLGGGTGSGAGPLITQIAKEDNALVLVFAAMPFSFEGRRRCQQAATSLAQLRSVADAVVCFENDRMAELALPRMGIHEAFAAADLTISQSIRSIAKLLQHPGLLHIGFDDVCAVLRNGDARALFGYGEAEGENRAHEALARALKSPLMNRGELLADAYHAVVHICGGTTVTLGEVQIVMEELNRHINDQTQIFMGVAINSKMGGKLSVSVLSSLGDGSVRAVAMQPPVPQSAPSYQPLPPSAPEGGLDAARPAQTALPDRAHAAMAGTASAPASGEGDYALVRSFPPGVKRPEAMPLDPASRGRFEKGEPTIIDGENLDIPTFLRKNPESR
jgi:cell division protein FtsZ